MITLAIESSCDETGVAILKDERDILSKVLISQMDIFKSFGGVVPEMASRNHLKVITKLIDKALKDANLNPKDIDLVAVTEGPGLIGSLLVGINAATSFAFAHQKKVIGVNHLAGHIYSANLVKPIKFPALALLVSGGHTELVYLKEHMSFQVIGQTLDDAVGEAYDKVARMLGVGYPGGPMIDKLAHQGEDTYNLPRPFLDDHGLDFSFSGLKSAVANLKGKLKSDIHVENMAASFQASVLDVLMHKLTKAVQTYDVTQLIIVGGVAANKGLRERISQAFQAYDVVIPPLDYCTDNAVMIGAAAYHQYQLNKDKNERLSYILGGQASLNLNEE